MTTRPGNEVTSRATAKQDWQTPQSLFDACNERFGPFDLDAAASHENTKCESYLSERSGDALITFWNAHRVWCNPPYNKTAEFVKRAQHEIAAGHCSLVVLLIPAYTDTAIWYEHIFPYAAEILFLRGRVSFSDAGPARFASAVVIFDKRRKVAPPYIAGWDWKIGVDA